MPGCLDRVARLEIVSLTAEDRAKTQMYAQERQRKELERDLAQRGGDVASYLKSLGMRMRIGLDDGRQIARLAQLTQKTNQFNLTTRRYSEEQIRASIESDHDLVGHFTLADRFGNSGVVGLAILRQITSGTAVLDTFLMSCRVIGRGVESAFIEALLRELDRLGVRQVVAEFIPTAKNALAAGFLAGHGFALQSDGTWLRTLTQQPARPASDFPIEVEIEREVPA
jgi:FkbH-like protein